MKMSHWKCYKHLGLVYVNSAVGYIIGNKSTTLGTDLWISSHVQRGFENAWERKKNMTDMKLIEMLRNKKIAAIKIDT